MRNTSAVPWPAFWLRILIVVTAIIAGGNAIGSPPSSVEVLTESSGNEHRVRHPLVITFPGVAPEDIANSWRPTSLIPSLNSRNRPEIISSSDPRLVDGIRRLLIPSVDIAGRANNPLCRPGSPGLSTLIDRAEAALDVLDLKMAEDSLVGASQAFTCAPEAAPTEELSRFLLNSGFLQILLDQDDEGRLEDAVALQGNIHAPSSASELLVRLLERARQNQPRIATAEVELWSGDLAGLTLLIDGKIQSSRIMQLQVGHHFLQLVSSDGGAHAGAIVQLEKSTDFSSTVWPPAVLRPPDPSNLKQALLAAVLRHEFQPGLLQALETFRAEHQYAWLTLMGREVQGPDVRILWIYPGGLTEVSPSQQGEESTPILRTSEGFSGEKSPGTNPREEMDAGGPPAGETVKNASSLVQLDETSLQEEETRTMGRFGEPAEGGDSEESYEAGGGFVNYKGLSGGTAPQPWRPRNKRAGAITTSILGVGAVATGMVFWGVRGRLQEETFPSIEEGERVRSKGLRAGMLSGAFATGALISAGMTWLGKPSGDARSRKIQRSKTLRLTASANAVAIHWGGAW